MSKGTKNNRIGQDYGQLGLHFEPDSLYESDSYPVTSVYWNKYRNSFRTSSAPVQLVIESGYHTLGEMEHNSPDTPSGDQDLDLAVLVIEELVKLVIERYGS